MNCDTCQNLDRRNGECLGLIHQMICGPCLRVFDCTDIRCSCGHMSQSPAGPLRMTEDGYQSSAYCPLTATERKALEKQQQAPKQVVRTQKELF